MYSFNQVALSQRPTPRRRDGRITLAYPFRRMAVSFSNQDKMNFPTGPKQPSKGPEKAYDIFMTGQVLSAIMDDQSVMLSIRKDIEGAKTPHLAGVQASVTFRTISKQSAKYARFIDMIDWERIALVVSAT